MRHLLFLLALPLLAETLEQAQAERDYWHRMAIHNANIANANALAMNIKDSEKAAAEAQANLCPGAQLDQAKFQQGVVACVPKPETKEISK